MAYQIYVTIEGMKQGIFKGDGGPAGPARVTGLAFNYGVTSPRDAATGQASGKRQHSQVAFVKAWSAASPQVFEACCTNEMLKSVLFEFVEADAGGKEQVSHSIKLTNATIASVKLDIQGPAHGAGGTTQDLEEIAMVFQRIDITTSGGTAAHDSWSDSAGMSRIATAGLASPLTIKAGGAERLTSLSPAIGIVAARGRLAG